MKRIIEIDESLYNRVKEKLVALSDIPCLCKAVDDSKPYSEVEEDKIIQCHSIESKAYVEWFKKGYKEGERTELDLAKRVIAKFEGYLDDDMIARIQIALEKESEAEDENHT